MIFYPPPLPVDKVDPHPPNVKSWICHYDNLSINILGELFQE